MVISGRNELCANLVLLCAFHHRLLHEGGFTLSPRSDGEIAFLTAEGLSIPAHPDLAPDRGIVDWGSVSTEWTGDPEEKEEEVEVDEWTTTPSWGGERMDLDWVVGTLT